MKKEKDIALNVAKLRDLISVILVRNKEFDEDILLKACISLVAELYCYSECPRQEFIERVRFLAESFPYEGVQEAFKNGLIKEKR